MKDKELEITKTKELRMYGFVPYNLSPIQQGIQFGHAVVEYQLQYDCVEENMTLYNDWARNWKTFIILNGGTTSNHYLAPKKDVEDYPGIQKIMEKLRGFKIPFSSFKEPDLNDATTAVVFIIREEIFDREKYPDYEEKYSYGRYSEEKQSMVFGLSQEEYYKEIFGSVKRGEYVKTVREFLFKYKFA